MTDDPGNPSLIETVMFGTMPPKPASFSEALASLERYCESIIEEKARITRERDRYRAVLVRLEVIISSSIHPSNHDGSSAFAVARVAREILAEALL